MIKFSVLLPTKNRLDLLKYAIDSVLTQNYQNWEIIVADNNSEDDIYSYVKSLNDERILYTRSQTPLTVTDNWNVANNLASGDYIVMLGDDDALCPGYFEECLNVIKKFNHPEILNYIAYIFTQPNITPVHPYGHIHNTRTDSVLTRESKEPYLVQKEVKENLVHSSLNFNYLFGFNMQYFLYSKKFKEKMMEYGEFYQGPYPDFYAANMMMLISDSIVVVPKELVIIGITAKSYGYYFHKNKEKEGMKFHNNHDYRKDALPSIKDKLCDVSEMDTAALVTFAIIPEKFPHRNDLHPNINEYLKCVTNRIYKDYNPLTASLIFIKEVLPKVNFAQKFKFIGVAYKGLSLRRKYKRQIKRNSENIEKLQYNTINDLLAAVSAGTL